MMRDGDEYASFNQPLLSIVVARGAERGSSTPESVKLTSLSLLVRSTGESPDDARTHTRSFFGSNSTAVMVDFSGSGSSFHSPLPTFALAGLQVFVSSSQ